MPALANQAHRWGVILAGGSGSRLRPLTRLVSGDDRPKQFCKLLDGQSLLERTRRRIRPLIPPQQTLLVFTQEHERYFQEELAAHPAAWAIVQPANRGTAPAILWSVLRLAELDWDSVVAILPSDHHYLREDCFRDSLERGFAAAAQDPETVVILGAPANAPETGYGWIEPGEAGRSFGVKRVSRFWEKPRAEVARLLLRQGCLWNTFVLVGTLHAFLQAISAAAPALFQALSAEAATGTRHIPHIYESIEPVDFSTQILARAAHRFAVASLGEAGWSDLGEPHRAKPVLEAAAAG